jgi:TPR repeat protein
VPIHRWDFHDLGFVDGHEDLGDLRLGPLVPLEGQDARPGYDKVARRLVLDEETLAAAAAEVAPLVESLTGWSGLLEGVQLRISDSLGLSFLGILEAASGVPIENQKHVIRVFNLSFVLSGIIALYDPFGRVIHVQRSSMERQNLDGLKVFLGHELIHAGQFREHPSLVEEQRPFLLAAAARLRGESPGVSPPAFGFMANIEGHAAHLEHDFLRKHYNCAEPLQHASTFEILTTVGLGSYSAALLEPGESTPTDSGGSKVNQYGAGLRAYRALARDGKPARFDPALRPENAAGDELDTTLLEERVRWGDLDSIYTLAIRLLDEEGPEADVPRGIQLLQSAAEAGHGAAQCELGSRYFTGRGVEEQHELFLSWTRKAMAAEVPRAFFNMAVAHDIGAGIPKNPAESYRLFLEAHERGYARARIKVARCLVEGFGVQKNPSRALPLLEQSASEGDPEACHWLARLLHDGIGTPADPPRALALFREAAEGDHLPAILTLAIRYQRGQGVSVDLAEASRWLERAVALGELQAKNALGVLILQRTDATRDLDRGLALLRASAEGGHLDAMHNLALLLLNLEPSLGACPLSVDEGVAWLTRAADAGRTGSQIKLGQLLIGGELCPADLPAGSAWIRRAADAGEPFAQYLYGLCVLHGLGVPEDPAESKAWLQKAADRGHPLAVAELAKLATPS